MVPLDFFDLVAYNCTNNGILMTMAVALNNCKDSPIVPDEKTNADDGHDEGDDEVEDEHEDGDGGVGMMALVCPLNANALPLLLSFDCDFLLIRQMDYQNIRRRLCRWWHRLMHRRQGHNRYHTTDNTDCLANIPSQSIHHIHLPPVGAPLWLLSEVIDHRRRRCQRRHSRRRRFQNFGKFDFVRYVCCCCCWIDDGCCCC